MSDIPNIPIPGMGVPAAESLKWRIMERERTKLTEADEAARESEADEKRAALKRDIAAAREKAAEELLATGMRPGDVAQRITALDAPWTRAADHEARIKELRGSGMSYGEIARVLSNESAE
ncbi:hypothetical protein [Spirillospora sp. NPDC029432]|uniref:hypothetical protein n=1 Tax=Spirillospora sp. NPDC029432 TaxID=3154599 RepID=UPI0034561E15